MRVIDRVTVNQNISDTVTVENLGRFLGDKSHKLGLVSTMYKHLSINTLTHALQNVYYNSKKKSSSFMPVKAMSIEWEIDVNVIKDVRITRNISGAGVGKQPVTIGFQEKYYNKHDIIRLDNGQLLRVVAPAVKLSTKVWEYTVIIAGNDLNRGIDITYGAKGKGSRYITNYHPELSERGYIRYVHNSELHRNHIGLHRSSVSYSGNAAILDEVFFATPDKKKERDIYFKLNVKEKTCLDDFMISRENGCLWTETNFDANGKCLDQEEDGRDIPMGDGIITQIKRYCNKFAYSILTLDVLDNVLSSMRSQSQESTGNTYAVVCNERMYDHVGTLMTSELRFRPVSDSGLFYSKAKGGNLKAGTTFDSYEFQGNTITFMVDKSLSQWEEDRAYGIFLDATANQTSGRPNVAMFTLEGAEIIEGALLGLGGKNGSTNGVISSSVHGSSYHIAGYSSAVIFNPYAAFILEEAVIL